jgi:pantoate--beta-alanine ligase
VVSIYVNPTQFNDKEDLKNYPRTIGSDINMLKSLLRENDVVFNPPDSEIYPEPDKRTFDFGNLGNVMEGLKRPGHFNGVGQVVSRLFDIVRPGFAYFGQKDFQQLAIVKELVRQTGQKVEIIGNPIIREPDGLAMSSRNRLLEAEIRKNAGIIYRALSEAALNFSKKDIPDLRSEVLNTIESKKGFSVEYFEIVDDRELVPVASKNELKKNRRYYGCIAVKAGKIRLIDNIEFNLA